MKNNRFITLVLLYGLFSILAFQNGYSQATITSSGGVPNGVSMSGIAYGNSAYVAVGATGYILQSSDGLNWNVIKNSSYLNCNYSKVIYANSLFVAIATDGSIVTSPDGTTWTQQTSNTTGYLNDIVYGNSKFIAVGNDNVAVTSANGTTWSTLNVGVGALDDMLSICYASGKFAVGVRDNTSSSSYAYTSTTGNAGTWSGVLASAAGMSLNKLSYINNKFWIFTSNTNIYNSSDGVSWSAFSNARLTGTNQIFSGLYDGTTYYFFGSSTENGYGSVFTSTDGSSFSLQTQSTTIVGNNSVLLNGKYYQMGNEGFVCSTDGTNWNFPSGSYNAVAYDGTRFVAVGQVTSSEAAVFQSTNYSTWTRCNVGIVKPLNGITYGGGKFVAVGNTNASSFSTYAVSSDGLSWSTGSTGIADALRAVAYGNSKYVAVGMNGRILYSSNGTSWTSAESVSGYNYYGVSYVNNYFVAVGGSLTANTGQVKVKYSSDGVTWTDVSPSTTIYGHFHSIAYGGSKYLLVGRDNTTGSQKFFSVTTSNITSNSGYSAKVTCTPAGGDIGTSGYGAVTYNNNTFVAVANLKVTPFSAYILTSTNGTSWTATDASTTGRLRGIIPYSNSFKAIGTLDTRLNIAAGSLPLNLVDFSARSSDNAVHLYWKTVNEYNTDHFEIERSQDARNYKAIGKVKSMNTPLTNLYSFTDIQTDPAIQYYRLKMIDIDGKFTYSPVLTINAGSQNPSISIYPNPASSHFTLSLPKNEAGTITLLNTKGKAVFQKPIIGMAEMINISQLPVGTYIVQVKQQDRVFVEKLVKN